jgi:hypothetical protein
MKIKFGLRIPSLKKRIASRLSVKRYIRHNMGLKAPRGWGWITNPRRALYNRIYRRTTFGCCGSSVFIMILAMSLGVFLLG